MTGNTPISDEVDDRTLGEFIDDWTLTHVGRSLGYAASSSLADEVTARLAPLLVSAEAERQRSSELGWYCAECRYWAAPWQPAGRVELSRPCPNYAHHQMFVRTPAHIERDDALAVVEGLRAELAERDALHAAYRARMDTEWQELLAEARGAALRAAGGQEKPEGPRRVTGPKVNPNADRSRATAALLPAAAVGGQHGDHAFEPGIDIDNPGQPDWRWCNVCGETLRAPVGGQAEPAKVYDAVRDLLWKATQYGETDDGDTASYLLPKGTVHRLVGAMQAIGQSAPLRNADWVGGQAEPSDAPTMEQKLRLLAAIDALRTPVDLPDMIAVDADGFAWRVWDDELNWSMARVNPDNSPIPEPVTFYAPVVSGVQAQPDGEPR